MGESRKRALRVGFDKSVKLEFHGAKISSDAGLMLHRELDEGLKVRAKIEEACRQSDRCRVDYATCYYWYDHAPGGPQPPLPTPDDRTVEFLGGCTT